MVQFQIGETYYFDLDKSIKERFAQLFPKYAPLVRKYCQLWIENSKPSQENLQKLEDMFDSHPDRELLEYCEFLSEQCQIERRILLYLQYMYDFGFDDSLSLGCTSILINEDKPYIVRNLDWDFHDVIRALTINAIYLKNNIIVSNHLSIVPQIFIPHTIKNNQIAISLNFLWPHYTVQQQWNQLLQNPQIYSIQRLIYFLSIAEMKYEDLPSFLEKQIVQHHGLLNIVGQKKGQCSIFYISDWSKANKYPPQQEIDQNEMFLLSTNGDYFEFSVQRYQAAQQKLKQLQNLEGPQQIVDNISIQYPNYNETTILVTVLEPHKKDEFKVYIK